MGWGSPELELEVELEVEIILGMVAITGIVIRYLAVYILMIEVSNGLRQAILAVVVPWYVSW